MKRSQPDHDPLLEDNDPLWRLLGESPRPQPDVWFAVRTLALCREAAQAAEARALSSFNGVWRWVLGGGLSVCLAVFLLVPQNQRPHPAPTTEQKNVQDAFQILATIDASDSDSSPPPSSTWQDSSL
jgi:hypothetical protein